MTDKVFDQSGLPIRRSTDFLPSVFKTDANSKFLGGVFDPLIQPGVLEKISGFIGRRYGKSYNGNDIYIDTDNTLRSRYQLEPGVVVTDGNGSVNNFYDYLDFKNQLNFFFNKLERDDLITQSQCYSWDPPIDWDKFVNFREYYWQVNGPPLVAVAGQAQQIESTYRVRSDDTGDVPSWMFYPDGLTFNPKLVLYRGQTYKFEVNSPRNKFSIRTTNSVDLVMGEFNPLMNYQPGDVVEFNNKLWKAKVDVYGDGSTIDEFSQDWELTELIDVNYYNKGVINNGIEVGTVTFTVPVDSPDMLYYVSDQEPLRTGQFIIKDITENTFIDVEKEILQKLAYTSSNNVKFTNGLMISFLGKTYPEKYNSGRWIIEGVGKGINLINFDDLTPPITSNNQPEIIFDNEGFDTVPFDEAAFYPGVKDYIISNRASNDNNPWSRSNRWFHKSVIEYAHQLNNSSPDADESSRAKRPIIEYHPNIQLFNHGSTSKKSVDFIDNYTSDIFSVIEGTSGYNIDGEALFNGARLLVTADTDTLVNNKIYIVNFISTQYSGNTGRQISLVEASDAVSQSGECVLINKGKKYRGKMFHYDGTAWSKSQEKTAVNQSPLFDVFDSDKVSFGNSTKYPVTNFKGTTILSYKLGNGIVDSEIGISLSYLNIDNIGDVLFEINWDVDSFTYQNQLVKTLKISSGFLKFNTLNGEVYSNTWIKTDKEFLQPIIDSQVITSVTKSITFNSVNWNESTTERIIFYKNGSLFKDQFTRTGNRNQTFVFANNFAVNDVITIKVYTDATPDQGYYEIPVGLEKNPLNQDLTSFTYGQVLDHLGTMLELDTRFTGLYPGNSNIRDISGFQKYGRRLLKHEGISALSLMLLCDKEINVIKSIDYAAKSYNQFRNNFLNLAVTLAYDLNPINFVDQIITEMSRIKTASNSFADSDMIGSGSYKKVICKIEDQIKTFALNEKFSLDTLSRKAVYVYKNNVQLLHGADYTFNQTFGYINFSGNLNEGDVLEVREYNTTSFNFIPSTPTKLGLYKKYVPRIFIDDTYITPTKVIQGHDGSITVAFNDFRDDLLLELERRIYNNIKVQYESTVFDIDATLGGYYNTGIFTKEQVDSILEPYFLTWITSGNVDYVNNTYFDSENTFTYTYNLMTDFTQQKNLVGWWRGVYQWVYDTDRPHTCPWEMLGFSEKPIWWDEEYGPAPYTRNNLILWEDIRDGRIRRGSRAGTHQRYRRSTILSHIPVNDQGQLLSPLQANLAQDFVLINSKGNFKFGDISPAEAAWRKSPQYPFALMSALSLLRPFEFISKSLDSFRVKTNIIGQTVYSETNKFIDINSILIPSVNGLQTTGLLNYIIDYIKGQDKDTELLTKKIKNLDIKLSNKLGGFVDATQQKYLLDSKNPKSKSSSIFIPQENYNIIFNIGTPFLTINYSGVIIEKVNTGWRLSGYDNKNPYFNYYEAVESKTDPFITVGGVTDSFLVWEPNKNYQIGQTVQYQGKYFKVLSSHQSITSFDEKLFKQISKLEQVGAVEVLKRQNFNFNTLKKLSYGTVLPTLQSVANFIFGYDQYLLTLGMIFDQYNYETQTVNNWTTSVKEFMFWSKHNWAEGQLITLSPAAYKFHIKFGLGSVDNLLDSFYDYAIYKRDGTVLSSSFINVNRDYQEFSITVTDTLDGIYFANINFVLKEHVVLFDDKTVFNDVLYDKTSGYRQDRVKVIGFRTTDWDGDYTSPGFIFDNVNVQSWQQYTDYNLGDIVRYREFFWTSKKKQEGTIEFNETNWTKLDNIPSKGLVANFDYRINQFEDYYDLDSDGLGSSQRDLARHSIGYQSREYLNNLSEDSVSQFKIYQGFIREKGTKNAITKIFDKLSRNNTDSVILKEEWAFRVGDFGGTDQYKEYEIALNKGQFKLTPQPLLINNSIEYSETNDLYYRIPINDFVIKPYGADKNIIPVAYQNVPNRTAGYVREDQVDFKTAKLENVLSLSADTINYGDHIWTTFVEPDQWSVFRYTRSNILIDSLEVNNSDKIVTLTCNVRHNFTVDQIIGIEGIARLSGYHKIISVEPFTFNVALPTGGDPEIDNSSLLAVGIFVDSRLTTAKELSDPQIAKLKVGDKLWIDNDENNRWEVIEKISSIYTRNEISDYGYSIPRGAGTAVIHLTFRNQTIASLPGSNGVAVYKDNFDGTLRNVQTLIAPDSFTTNLLGKFGYSLHATSDEQWLFVGSPLVSGIGSRFQGIFSETEDYEQNDIVLFAGKLWRATRNLNGDGSTITLESADWEYVYNIPADTYQDSYDPSRFYRKGSIVKFGIFSYIALQNTTNNLPINQTYWALTTAGNSGYIEQGMVSIYRWYEEQWNYEGSFVSPRPQPNELFGFSITSGISNGKYYLAISAPGAVNATGAVYLYTLNDTDNDNPIWELIEDESYQGVYDPSRQYIAGSIVYYANKLWKAKSNQQADGSTITVNSADWIEMEDTITQSSLPTSAAMVSDGTISEVGLLPDSSIFRLPEIVKQGDQFGTSIAFNSDASTLIVGSPYGDDRSFTNYKGVWKSYTLYGGGDVVRYESNYYRVNGSTSINDIPTTGINWTLIDIGTFDSSNKKFGKVFVYKRNDLGVYRLFQTINNQNLSLLSDIGLQIIETGDRLGSSVDIDATGDTLVVSAPYGDYGYVDNGYVYVFKYSRTNEKYVITNKISGSDASNFELYGTQVKISNDANSLVVSGQNSITKFNIKYDLSKTRFDQNTTTFFDKRGNTGRVYVYEKQDTEYYLAEELDPPNLIPNESFGFSLDLNDNVIVVGSPTLKTAQGVIGQVRKFKRSATAKTWSTIGQQEPQTRIDLIKSLALYDVENNKKITDVDIVDHYKYKFLGIVEQEISFKNPYDPAIYSKGNDSVIVDSSRTWYETNVGKIWVNFKTVKWTNYEQGELSYKIGHWNELADSSSVDVYEWVETKILPSQWSLIADTTEGLALNISGQPLYANDTVYNIKEVYDEKTGTVLTSYYYYWVKNSVVVPDSSNRKISAAEVALYITSPISSGIPFVGFISQDRLLAYNFEKYLPSTSAVLNIKFNNSNKNINLIHHEYELLTEGQGDSVPTLQLEQKWIDSLIGYDQAGNKVPDPNLAPKQKYGILFRPRQSMFVNKSTALKIFVDDVNAVLREKPFAETLDFTNLNAIDEVPTETLKLYDVSVETYAELITINAARVRPALLRANLIDGQIESIDIVDSGFGYRVAPPVSIVGTGSGARVTLTIDNSGKVTGYVINNPGKKYDNVILNVRGFSVLVKTDETYRNYWAIYQFNERNKTFYRSLTQDFDTTKYWSYIDWWAQGYNSSNKIIDEIPGTYYEPQLAKLIDLKVNDLIKVSEYGSGGWAVLKLINLSATTINEKYELVGRYRGTIEISSLIYDDAQNQVGYDNVGTYDLISYDNQPVSETRNIIKAIKENILIDEFKFYWNKLFFNSIHFIFSEQLYVDWAFKTSFLNAIHTIGDLEQKSHYKNDNLESYEQYLKEVKPYRTKIREFTSTYNSLENTQSLLTDFDLPPYYEDTEGKLIPVKTNNEILNTYPWKLWKDNNTYKVIEITVYDSGSGYINPPTVVINGGGGSGAEALAYVSNGSVTGVVITKEGIGYTSAPTVTLVGGFSDTGTQAKASAIIGKGTIRSFDITMKFDRISKNGTYSSFVQDETIVASGVTSVFNLKYPPSRDRSKITVYLNNGLILSNEYELSLFEQMIDGFTFIQGRIKFLLVPATGTVIRIIYSKNDEILDSVDRIKKYYNPLDGMTGKDVSQLMTGIDFGGVIIQGSSFNSTGGWDALPWFSDSWDSVTPNSDYYVIADGSTTSIQLPYTPSIGQAINVYIKRGDFSTLPDKTGRFTRIDDPYYNVYDGSTVQPNGKRSAPAGVLMNTFIGNGVIKDIDLPILLATQAGDILIFRPSTSDGSVNITDTNVQDTLLSGGSLLNTNNIYSTANGLTAEEIVVSGDKFISPDQVPSPEENVPGQVLDTVSIKTFHRTYVGAAQVKSNVYFTDGIAKRFKFTNKILESKSVSVYLDKVKQGQSLDLYNISYDYYLDFKNSEIEFFVTPPAGKIVEIVSIGPGGYAILDFSEFVGDGATRYFLTKAQHVETSYIIVTVNGLEVPVSFVTSKGLLNDKDETVIEFSVPPSFNQVVKILVLGTSIEADSSGQSAIRINEQIIIHDGSTRLYDLDKFVNLERSSAAGNMLVEVNNRLIPSGDTQVIVYNGSNNSNIIGQDPYFGPGSIDVRNISVYINEIKTEFISDWILEGSTNLLTITKSLIIGDEIRIEIAQNNSYKIENNEIRLLPVLSLNPGDLIKVIWFSEYPTMSLIKDRFPGNYGVMKLRRKVTDISTVWVYKNGFRLAPEVEYEVNLTDNFVKLTNLALSTDDITLVIFGQENYNPVFAYEIFKDMLNLTHYKRYIIGQVKLTQELNYYDTQITVDNGDYLFVPDIINKIPGTVTINSERINYYQKNGNILSQLTRGILGTSIPEKHNINSDVVDVGIGESLPYREYQNKEEFISDGTSLLIGPLLTTPIKSTRNTVWYRSTIPATHGPNDQYEVFVNGKRLRKNPYKRYQETNGLASPLADIDVEAEFSVDGTTPYIRLTTAISAGSRIVIISKTGNIFYDTGLSTAASGITLINNDSVVAQFLRNKSTK